MQGYPRPVSPTRGSPCKHWIKSGQLQLKGIIFQFYISNLRPLAEEPFLLSDFSLGRQINGRS